MPLPQHLLRMPSKSSAYELPALKMHLYLQTESTIPFLSENGVKIHIGKGILSDETAIELKKIVDEVMK